MDVRITLCLLALAGLVAPPAAVAQSPSTPSTEAPAARNDDEPARREQLKKELREAMDALASYSVERREEAIAGAQKATAALDAEMARLQERMDLGVRRMSQAARDRSRLSMDDLHRRRTDLAEWMGGLRHGSATAWDEVKRGFARSADELEQAMQRARAQFEHDQGDAAKPESAADKAAEAKPAGKDK
jgi:hypothetical protein